MTHAEELAHGHAIRMTLLALEALQTTSASRRLARQLHAQLWAYAQARGADAGGDVTPLSGGTDKEEPPTVP